MAKKKVKIVLKNTRFLNFSVDFYGADKDDIAAVKKACDEEEYDLLPDRRYDYTTCFIDYGCEPVVEVDGEEYSCSSTWNCFTRHDDSYEVHLPEGIEEHGGFNSEYMKAWLDKFGGKLPYCFDYLPYFTKPKGCELFFQEVQHNRNKWGDYYLEGEIELEEGENFDPDKFMFIETGFFEIDEEEICDEWKLASAYGFVYDGKWYPFNDKDQTTFIEGTVGLENRIIRYYLDDEGDVIEEDSETVYRLTVGDCYFEDVESEFGSISDEDFEELIANADKGNSSDTDASDASSGYSAHTEFLKKFIEYADIKMLKVDKPNGNYVRMQDEKMKAVKSEIFAKITQKDLFVNFLYDKSLGKAIYDDIVANHKADVEKNVSRFGSVEWVSNEGKHPYVKVSAPLDNFKSDEEKFVWLKDVVLNLYNSMSSYIK